MKESLPIQSKHPAALSPTRIRCSNGHPDDMHTQLGSMPVVIRVSGPDTVTQLESFCSWQCAAKDIGNFIFEMANLEEDKYGEAPV